MTSNKRVHSEFNIGFITGIALKPIPLAFFQPILKKAMQIMQNKHPAMFGRLSEIENPTFLIDVVDLPFSFFRGFSLFIKPRTYIRSTMTIGPFFFDVGRAFRPAFNVICSTAHKSMTTSRTGCEQHTRRLPSAGRSSGSGP